MSARRKFVSALIASLLAGLVALQAPSVSPVGAVGGGWEAMGTGTSGGTRSQVMDIAVADNGMVYIGGWFAGAGGAANTGYVAQWNPTTSAWSALGTGGVTATLYGVCSVELDNPANPARLYVGGDFESIGGVTTDNSAYWSFGGGGSWNALDQGTRVIEACPEEIVAVTPNDIYFAGSNTLGRNYFSYYNVTTSSFSSVGTGFSGRVFGLTTDGTNLYATGQFASTSATPQLKVNGVAQTPIASPLWTGIGSNPTTSAAPDCLSGANQKFCTEIAVSGNKIFVGGSFPRFQNNGTDVSGTANLAMWDGSAWTSIGSVNGTVEEVKVIGTGASAYLYIGGSFACVGDRLMNNIARYKIADGTWEAVGDGSRAGVQVVANGAVRSIEPDHTGNSIYVGGSFSDAGGIAAADNIAKLTPVATQAGPCNPPSAETAPVLAFDAPPNFRAMYYGVYGRLPNYNNGQQGLLIDHVWDAPVGVNYYIYKVSAERITKRTRVGNKVEYESVPLDSSYDCWSVGLTCTIIISKDDPYYAKDELLFRLRGFTFEGVGKSVTAKLPGVYDPVFPADPPTDVVAVSDWNKVHVSWKTPKYTGTYPITNYLVQATPGGSVCITRLTDPDLNKCTYTSLTPGINYTFKVQALNGAGWGDRSAASAAVSPQNIQITKNSRNRVRFLFINRGSDIVAEGIAPGYPAGSSVTAWVMYNNSGQWVRVEDVRISAFGTFSWKRRFPTNQDRNTIAVTFTLGDKQGNVVSMGPVR